MASKARNNKKFAKPCEPVTCMSAANAITVQNHHSLYKLFLESSYSFPSGFIKLTAKTGLKINATINDAASVRIKMVGR